MPSWAPGQQGQDLVFWKLQRRRLAQLHLGRTHVCAVQKGLAEQEAGLGRIGRLLDRVLQLDDGGLVVAFGNRGLGRGQRDFIRLSATGGQQAGSQKACCDQLVREHGGAAPGRWERGREKGLKMRPRKYRGRSRRGSPPANGLARMRTNVEKRAQTRTWAAGYTAAMPTKSPPPLPLPLPLPATASPLRPELWLNRFAALGPDFHTELAPQGMPQPLWVARSEACAAELGWPADWWQRADWNALQGAQRQRRLARHAQPGQRLQRPPVRRLGRPAWRRPRPSAGRAGHTVWQPGAAAEGRRRHALLAPRRRPRGAALLDPRVPLLGGHACAGRAQHPGPGADGLGPAGAAAKRWRRRPSSPGSRPAFCASAISNISRITRSPTSCASWPITSSPSMRPPAASPGSLTPPCWSRWPARPAPCSPSGKPWASATA